LYKKSENILGIVREVYLVWIAWIATIAFSPTACAFASRPVTLHPGATDVKTVKAGAAEIETVNKVCKLVFEGRFDAADKLIVSGTHPGKQQGKFLRELAGITAEYDAISKRRHEAREKAYTEQLAELQKIETGDVNDVEDPNSIDPNDPNDLSAVLLVIGKAREFADDDQRVQLLGDDFVKKMIQRAVDRAVEFEAEGKWLEAYTNCYYWLTAIDPNNEAYSDYSEQLLEKAQIAASFEDSPCETRKERYDGIKKEMFERAIYALSVNYVSMIDFHEMSTKALNRCKLLAEVMAAPSIDPNNSPYGNNNGTLTPPDKQKLMAWSAALAAVEDEMSESVTGFNKSKFSEVFDRLLKLNATIVELPVPTLIAQFAEAALSALDPYTVMVWPKQVQDFEKLMMNEFTGIGIEISKRLGQLTVASLLPDTPAYNSGLDAGDVIEKVDGLETKDMTLVCAVHKITGPKGTKVNLTIKRPGEEKRRDITITRAKITVPTIRGWQRTEEGRWLYMVDEQEKIGYIRLTSFSGESSADMEKVLLDLEQDGLNGLILDLRYNTGGLLDTAVDVCDKFLDGGLIVKTQPGPGLGKWPSYSTAKKGKTHPEYPLVVLINAGSASASEIVAGALADKEHKRAILVGTRTHGKGSVQGITHYPGGGAQLKYTMAYYHLPSNQRVESREAMKKLGRTDWGVGVNVEVKLRSDETKEMIDMQRDNDVLVQAGRNGAGPELKKHTIEETLNADPQLAVALLVAKSKLIQARATGQVDWN
jgi:carboxyl-terminal processing protease